MVFYRAMLLFAAKHFEGGQARAFSWMIRFAICSRAALAVMRRLSSRWGEMIRIATLTFILMLAIMWSRDTWGSHQYEWPEAVWKNAVLLFVQLFSMWALGGYRAVRAGRPASGHALAWGVSSLFTLGLYSLWPETWRFSRMTVLGLLAVHGLVHAAITYRAWRRQGNPFRIRRLLVASKDMESMADLLRRNEGERTRLQSFALWAGETLPHDTPDLQGFHGWV